MKLIEALFSGKFANNFYLIEIYEESLVVFFLSFPIGLDKNLLLLGMTKEHFVSRGVISLIEKGTPTRFPHDLVR